MANTRVVKIKPTAGVWNFDESWKYGFCNCCTNVNFLSIFRLPCFLSFILNFLNMFTGWAFCLLNYTMNRTNECLCQPLVPRLLLAFQTKIRTAFWIDGSIFEDCRSKLLASRFFNKDCFNTGRLEKKLLKSRILEHFSSHDIAVIFSF